MRTTPRPAFERRVAHLARREHTPGYASNVARLSLRDSKRAQCRINPACIHAGLNGVVLLHSMVGEGAGRA